MSIVYAIMVAGIVSTAIWTWICIQEDRRIKKLEKAWEEEHDSAVMRIIINFVCLYDEDDVIDRNHPMGR